MGTIELFYFISGLFLVASGVAYFFFKNVWLGLALFGTAFLALAVRGIISGGDSLMIILNAVAAVIFLFKAGDLYRKGSRTQKARK